MIFLNTESDMVMVFTSASMLMSLRFSNMHSDIVILEFGDTEPEVVNE